MSQLSDEVTEFLEIRGIVPQEQHPGYKLEIAYRMGYEDALRNFGIWRDSEQRIGCVEKRVKDILAEFQNKEVPLRY